MTYRIDIHIYMYIYIQSLVWITFLFQELLHRGSSKAIVPRSWTSSWARAPKPCISISSSWAQRKMYEEMLFFKTFVFFRKEMLFLSQGYFRVHQPKFFVAQDDQPPKSVKLIAKLIGNPWHPAFWRHNMFSSSAVWIHVCVSTREAWGRLCFSACVSSHFSPVPQIRTLAPWAGPHFRIGCGVGGFGRAKVHSDGHEIWALGGGRQLGRPQLCKVSTVYEWPTCL